MASLYNTISQPDESQDSEFTAASALACLAKNDGKNINNTSNHDDDEKEDEKEDFSIPQRFTKSGRKRAVPFTIKLMKVLSDKQNAQIITWTSSGKSFQILKPKAFVADILPEHFKTAKYSSFTRKLHRWGFMRHYRGAEAGAFYHKDFQRGRLDLVEEMTCHKAEPPKSAAAISAAALSSKTSPVVVKPVVLRPTPVPAPKKTVVPIASFVSPPATPKVMATLKMPSSLVQRQQQQQQQHVVTRTPSMVRPSVTSGLPPMAPSLSASHTTGAPTLAALESERLNAAIEREVNRRLQERINAVALSRQAFAVSALRQQQLASMAVPRSHTHSHSSQLTALLMQKQAEMLKNTRLPLNMAPPLGPYRAMASSSAEGQSSLRSAPPTNIQGARTA